MGQCGEIAENIASGYTSTPGAYQNLFLCGQELDSKKYDAAFLAFKIGIKGLQTGVKADTDFIELTEKEKENRTNSTITLLIAQTSWLTKRNKDLR